MVSPGGMFIEDIDLHGFDAQFFNLNNTEAIAMEPQQRQLLEVVYECLENGGITLERISGKEIGCFVASYAVDFQDIQARDPANRADDIAVGVGRSIQSNRISHFLNITGPSLTIDTACSGGLVSLDIACRFLQSGMMDGAIIASANINCNPEHAIGSGSLRGTVSESGRCHTFDAKADGYVKAEAVNCIFIKRLKDAVRDGDPVRAVIRGTSSNSNGRTPGIASPSSESQAAAIRAAYAHAGISDFRITSFLECHGTGTQAGDPVEANGAGMVFMSSRPDGEPLIIGSIKSNIGHSENAAGISSLLKAIMAVESGIIPGTPSFMTPNPNIDFEKLCLRVSRSALKWPESTQSYRRASINSFGFGGTNAHVIIDSSEHFMRDRNIQLILDHSTSYCREVDGFFDDIGDVNFETHTLAGRGYRLLVFSAARLDSVKSYVASLRAHLTKPSVRMRMCDLAYTLSERRTRHFHRGFDIVANSEYVRSDQLNPDRITFGRAAAQPPRVGFVFTGQGAQWPQMGRDLLESFPLTAGSMISRLDAALQSLPASVKPDWSLHRELTEQRDAEHMRLPEFAQPLVTALQLAIVEVLTSWGISPRAVIGHSSGEIAAACTAGFLTPEEAIAVAYLRGYAAKETPKSSEPLGMMAVGLGAQEIQPYLDRFLENGNAVAPEIACYNSPLSVTVAGTVTALRLIGQAINADGHFARLLQVDLAYHSSHMADITTTYGKLLTGNMNWEKKRGRPNTVNMYSSVLNEILGSGTDTDVAYWEANMVSPVRFNDACLEMMKHREHGADFIIEIGPSNALAGPVEQIKKSFPNGGENITYISASKRGADTLRALYSVAGQLFIEGGDVSLVRVNVGEAVEGKNLNRPSLIVDLPNYAWDRSTKYWHESQASTEWRFKKFIHHDLLGSKVPGTAWNIPTWRNILRLSDLPWLRDHKIGTDIVFPASAYIVMAIEAVHQSTLVSTTKDGRDQLNCGDYHYQLRDVKFSRALVLDDSTDAQIMLSLSPSQSLKSSWRKFEIMSTTAADVLHTTSHCIGFVRLRMGRFNNAPAQPDTLTLPLKHPTPGKLWYNSMREAGYGFGPNFQNHLEVEAILGRERSRSLVTLNVPPSKWKQSHYPLHPAAMDGCFQIVLPSLWRGDRSSINKLLVPAGIDSLHVAVFPPDRRPDIGLALGTRKYLGRGRVDDQVNFASYSSVYSPVTGDAIFDMKGLRHDELEIPDGSVAPFPFTRLEWKPDFGLLTDGEAIRMALRRPSDMKKPPLHAIIDLIAHKLPQLSVLEVNLIQGDTTSAWLDQLTATRAACKTYHFMSKYPENVLGVEKHYNGNNSAHMAVLDPSDSSFQPPRETFDLAIVKAPQISTDKLAILYNNLCSVITEAGTVVFVLTPKPPKSTAFEAIETSPTPSDASLSVALFIEESKHFKTRYIHQTECETVFVLSMSDTVPAIRGECTIAHLPSTGTSKSITKICQDLSAKGWKMEDHGSCLDSIRPGSLVLVLDELMTPVLATATEAQWDALKGLVARGYNLVWVTQGSQMTVTNPDAAVAHGVFRSIRSEEPLLNIITLDVESNACVAAETVSTAIDFVLQQAQKNMARGSNDFEYAERNGILHIPRLVPDKELNSTQTQDAPTGVADLHGSRSTIRLVTGTRGRIDSLQWAEVGTAAETPLKPGFIEVEIYASSLNFKDVIVAMGIIPENERLLGLDGAGVITRVGSGIDDRRIGQRVAVFERGTLANRVITRREYTMVLPDSISFEEGASMPVVFITSMEALLHLAHIQKDHKVLIHSAAGGIGIASIQLCQYRGCEVYVTVGSQEKRQFLQETFNIPDDHIFSSRDISFASRILATTDGYGVDVILNSLTGELLEESWRIIAAGGVMVEIGKQDILERSALPMEPFARNASFRALDLSLKNFSKEVIRQHLDHLYDLLQQGDLKPIKPISVVPLGDVQHAFRLLGSGKHIGKLVISNGSQGRNTRIPIHLPKRSLAQSLNTKFSYLLVGGLKGLCGNLAVWLAKNGAKHLAVIARGDYQDERSQRVVRDIAAQGCEINLLTGDVTDEGDVRRCFASITPSIGGIVQGAMVLRDRMFSSMTHQEYHEALSCKVQGTWNLHNVSVELNLPLSFFTMLSSISGIVGQKGQANYSGANTFLDSLAVYRRSLGLPACSVDLGIVEGIGYLAEHENVHRQLTRNADTWAPINEARLRQVFELAIYQQEKDSARQPNPLSASQMVTGICIPIPSDAEILRDARFSGLRVGQDEAMARSRDDDGDKELQTLLRALQSKSADTKSLLPIAVKIANVKFGKLLRLAEPMDPSRPMSIYGLDSLVAVEFRNWARSTLGAELSTLEITNASSLTAIGEKLIAKALSAAAA